ncbi:hypothetical protein IM316_01620 [Enterobacter cloacae complex sp. S4]|uniref:Uncharacterized protein n=1 Tax=Enterobacter roggenkampii TaxID=1812935 RepID=A0AAX1WMI1_9ENTR|nr:MULTISPECIES: hypothetical protein [Enterobacter cloacae complex]CAE6287127.1 hypothetical protein AI2705V1_3745 [Enterobacter cloacae]EHF8255689.1 hypothetical protein [Enterobacter roggenkampii]EJO46796.1 hypothetical protein B498_2029 [Enterobacter sp. SST3]EKY3958708.1 hypothetical protein [Enterobacter roggenkampii]ELD8600378.1 hypothetical protein [Enterobacter roggenkampii]
MKYIIALFFLCLPMGLFAKNHTPEQILQMINGKGARHVVAQLYANDSDESEWWNHVIPEISKGNQKWLAVASALEPGVDASTAEDLKAALSEAIPHNPQGVLAILKDDKPLLTIEQICAFDNFPETEAESNKLFVDSIREMFKIKSPPGKRCLAVMISTVEHSVPFDKDM